MATARSKWGAHPSTSAGLVLEDPLEVKQWPLWKRRIGIHFLSRGKYHKCLPLLGVHLCPIDWEESLLYKVECIPFAPRVPHKEGYEDSGLHCRLVLNLRVITGGPEGHFFRPITSSNNRYICANISLYFLAVWFYFKNFFSQIHPWSTSTPETCVTTRLIFKFSLNVRQQQHLCHAVSF